MFRWRQTRSAFSLFSKRIHEKVFIPIGSIDIIELLLRTKTKQAYSLQPTEQYLEYEIDEETRVPLYHLYTLK